MPGPPFLAGEAVDLRTFEEEDVAFVRDSVNDARVWPSLGGQVTPTNLAQERRFFETESHDDDTIKFVVTRRGGGGTEDAEQASEDATVGERVGMVELNEIDWDRGRAEVAFWIAPEHQSAGHGRDALVPLIDYAFDQLRLHKLVAEAFASNEASTRLLESVGFEREGRLREEEYVDGEWIDVIRYGLLADGRVT